MNAFIVYYYYLSNGLQTSATFQRRFESGFYDDFNTVSLFISSRTGVQYLFVGKRGTNNNHNKETIHAWPRP
jgi:hypothetical protein